MVELCIVGFSDGRLFVCQFLDRRLFHGKLCGRLPDGRLFDALSTADYSAADFWRIDNSVDDQ